MLTKFLGNQLIKRKDWAFRRWRLKNWKIDVSLCYIIRPGPLFPQQKRKGKEGVRRRDKRESLQCWGSGPLFAAVILSLSEAGRHEGSTWQSEITPFIIKKQKRKGREWGLTSFFVGAPHDMGLYLGTVPLWPPSHITGWRLHFSHLGLWGLFRANWSTWDLIWKLCWWLNKTCDEIKIGL